jgi:hypothetical protein
VIALVFASGITNRFATPPLTSSSLPRSLTPVLTIMLIKYSSKKNAPAITTTLSQDEQLQLKKLQENIPYEKIIDNQPPSHTHPQSPFTEDSRLGHLASAGDLPSLIRLLEVFFFLSTISSHQYLSNATSLAVFYIFFIC